MTADNTMETNGLNLKQAIAKRAGRKRSSKRGVSTKRTRASVSGRSTSGRTSAAGQTSRTVRLTASKGVSTPARGRRGRRPGRASVASAVGEGIASRVLSRGRRAVGDAYEWATEAGGRAMPLASHMPDQRMVQRLVDQRPYMLGALGLGIGAMIGLMLPGALFLRAGGRSLRGRGHSRP